MMTIMLWILLVSGLIMGSFLGVLIDRLPQDKTIMGRSMCDICEKVLHPLSMIPVLSYIAMKGRSMCCKKKISAFYPGFEILTGVSYMLTYIWYETSVGLLRGGSIMELIAYLTIVSALLVIFFADVKYHIIPDEMNIVLILAGFFIGSRLFDIQILLSFVLAGAILGGALFALFFATKGKGLGFGDVKFAFVMGFLLGLKPGMIALYIAFVAGGIISSVLLLAKISTTKSKIAFGPFLILGLAVMLFCGEHILGFVDNLFF